MPKKSEEPLEPMETWYPNDSKPVRWYSGVPKKSEEPVEPVETWYPNDSKPVRSPRVSKKSYTTCEVVGVGLKYRKTCLSICLNILCFSFRKGGGVCGGTVVVHLSGENRINFFCIQIHDPFLLLHELPEKREKQAHNPSHLQLTFS